MTYIFRTTGEPFGVRPTQSTASSTAIPNTAPYPSDDLAELLRDVPLEAIVSYLREREYEVSTRPFFRPDRVLAPLADDDPLPFEEESPTQNGRRR